MTEDLEFTDMILIHPPIAKPSEPPAGIAGLCGALSRHGIRHGVLDANLEGLLNLLMMPPGSSDTWSRRASRHLPIHLASMRSWTAYRDHGRYRRAIGDLNHLLEMSARSARVRLGLANYQHEERSPLRSTDLLSASEHPEENPFYPYFRRRLKELLEREKPSLIGFSLNYLSQALTTFSMAGLIRREWPGIELVLGGGLATSWMRTPDWRNPFKGLIDHLVAGPGEGPLLLLNGAKDLKGSDHDQPNYDLLPMKEYFSPGPVLPYSASKGCYWNRCSFCPERAEGNPYRPVSDAKVVLDLRQLVERQKPVLIHLVDNAISPSLLRGLSVGPPGVPWYGFARITRHLTNLDFCLSLRRSGCVMLKLGLESGDQTVLDNLQKGVDLEVASSVLKNLKEAGIATYVYLLFGTPAEGLTEARKTLEFVVRHHDCIGFLNLAIFNMPIFGPDARVMETRRFYEGDLSLYADFNHPKGWDRQSVRQFLDKEFKRHPAIAPILRRDPPVFTSNHAPFFVRGVLPKGGGPAFKPQKGQRDGKIG